MASPTHSILEGFVALRDRSSRREVLNAILDTLDSYEIREVKSRLEPVTFQLDLLGKLPIELVAMLVEYLDLADLVILQRVSKRWRELLSSTIVFTTAVRHHMGENIIKSGSTPIGFGALVKKRIRAERGIPAVVATIPNNLCCNVANIMEREALSCFNGVCAWIEKSTDQTTIFMVNLSTGKNRILTTANRERFIYVQVSDTLVSAISVRGYCHVWNISEEQYKSFRIPSLKFGHYISIGSKVMLGYSDSVVHFCFDSGIARSIKIGPFVLLLSVHPEEDGFSVVCVRRKNGDNTQAWADGHLYWEEHHLQTQKFSVHDNRFICTWEQYRELPFRQDELWMFRCKPEDSWPPWRVCPRPGQSSTLLDYDMTEAFMDRSPNYLEHEDEYGSLSLSLEADDRITVHFRCENIQELEFNYSYTNLDYAARGPGLIYCLDMMLGDLKIGCEFPELWHARDAEAYSSLSFRRIPFAANQAPTAIWGDGDFALFLVDDKIWIWCFDEAWIPSGIPNMKIEFRDLTTRTRNKK
ncbi:hypothetical protein DTO013E5_6990 [Penicillium roqueforti]|uniref:F-box domain, cyclin-like n=1 Tax=Penicillium roqueforti (strain FM164) TaxID=1365484 RepID=W6PSJ3_PENRF|nr:uncharacterized protein LCP9604111_8346 [Penicillium roqueforti]CDM26815.1 F-box domain, cyclin-like [Penicillium roqueforti FM164]KAF9241737.1 hypothetical protein LCP9604111_8346 [Penicillium roqueforti]KAI2673010.1 hypothetical protein CBS147355_7813 [Penicillium roqueforti]KAI2674288.1 hypothetical protein LCP963914a_8904 [Penicillium roqueforti]KAI2703250.1 hypothetical protein CBS147372_3565 [Penicillium roqueforti]